MLDTTARPFGLRHQVALSDAFTSTPPGITYDPALQQSTVDGRPLADQPDLLAAFTVTYGTTGNDNKTDDGG